MRKIATALFAFAALPLHGEITTKISEGNLDVHVDGKLFTTYRSDTRVPCLHPLMSPSGTHLTRQYPFVKDVKGEAADHPHHTGFWFTHGAVNGKDFWHKPDCRIVHKGFLEMPVSSVLPKSGDQVVSFSVTLAWEAGGKTHLTEVRSYVITIGSKTRTINVTSMLTAKDGDAVFGDTKEGSFSIRLAPSLRLKGEVAKGHILNSEGVKDGDAWGKRAKWVAYHGPDAKGTPTVVAILDHAKNLRHPTWWHARDYGLLGANPFGQHHFERKKDAHLGDYTLAKGKTLTQRYRLILHEGDLDSAKIENNWKAWTK